MGLLYPFPVSTEEADFVHVDKSGRVQLKSYGLPYLFWGYAAASLTALFFLWIAVRDPMEKLAMLGGVDALLVFLLKVFLISLPLVILGFFFYEKTLIAHQGQLTVIEKLFALPVRSRSYQLASSGPYTIGHYLSAPNVARLKGESQALGFQNKGYFVLWAHTEDQRTILLDRHSRKSDLEALVKLLTLESIDEPR